VILICILLRPSSPQHSLMAPKAQPAAKSVTRGTKRSAAVLKRPAAASSSSPGGRKITASQRQSVVTALEGADELPQKVRDMLASLAAQDLSDSLHPYQEAAMAVVGEALTDIETRLRREFEEARAVFEKDADKSAREEALCQAKAYLDEQQQQIQHLKPAIKESAQAMKSKQEELQSARAAQKSLRTEHSQLEAKIVQLQAAEKDIYEPLKETSAIGREGQKKVEVLQKVGKDFGFHDVLMDVLPVVLKKQPNRRRTFDGVALQHFEVEVSRHSATLGAALKEREACIEETSEVLQALRSALDHAKTEHASHTSALAQARENLTTGKNELLEAQRRVRMFDSDMRKCVRDLEDKAAKLKAFQKGPLAAFQKLSNRAPVEVPAPAAAVSASASASDTDDSDAMEATSADEEGSNDQDEDPEAMETRPIREEGLTDEDEDSDVMKARAAQDEGLTDEDENSDDMRAESIEERVSPNHAIQPRAHTFP